jgi:hypothetical protein
VDQTVDAVKATPSTPGPLTAGTFSTLRIPLVGTVGKNVTIHDDVHSDSSHSVSMTGPATPQQGETNAILDAVVPQSSSTDRCQVRSSTAIRLSPIHYVFQRPCGNKSCDRTIPAETEAIICGRCRTRMKKYRIKVKQRFKLEPRKATAQAMSKELSENEESDEEVVMMVGNGDKN